ncbi:sensor histidine kinase [Deinococcus marmoris]|uniref:histidine kinase n=1 Tax=Deinococcus marmoris TaxID=249408 RepID=A0A1U7P4I2_9DEIO|nr:ATP-binding protein [Deinococcus marmoris]OLV20069.1 two-component sensor histidine kinase protein [Deinococcus marmoris]
MTSEELLNTRQALAEAQQQIKVLSTFMALTQAAATISDLEMLARSAQEVLQAHIPGLQAAFYRCVGERWVAQQTTDGLSPEFLDLVRHGLPLDTPPFAQTVQAGGPMFFEDWDAGKQRVPFTEAFGAVALAPYFRDGRPGAVLAIGLVGASVWTPEQRQLFSAVHQAVLGAQQRGIQTELHERQLGLEAFMQLTEAIGVGTDRVEAAQRARDLLLELLPEWSFGYYELQDGLWKALLAEVPDPVLREALAAGLPISTPSFQAAVGAGGPVFFDEWDAAEQRFDHSEGYGVTGFYPYLRRGQPIAMFAIGSPQRRWQPQERAVFLAVSRSLELALERGWAAAELEASYRQLERSNDELMAANGELEAFAYSASHDLRTPVRHVKGFTELIRRALDSGQPEKAERSLNVLDEAADQMTRMIDAMLELSRSTRQPLRREDVSLSQLVDEARQDVHDELAGREIEWRLGALPTVPGDRATLRQVMTNLLSNAVKFTRRAAQPVIEVWTDEDEDGWTVWVRDNGAGFDPAYEAKLFGPFQRLHLQKDFEGTGIGLATVRRIILRHGGRVTASSALDQGATFSFTLPRTVGEEAQSAQALAEVPAGFLAKPGD